MLDRGSEIFSYFLDVQKARKAFDTVWIDRLLHKLFSDLSVKGKLWLVITDTDVSAWELYSGALLREFGILQGTRQGKFWPLICIKFTRTVF